MIKQNFNYIALYFTVLEVLLYITTERDGGSKHEYILWRRGQEDWKDAASEITWRSKLRHTVILLIASSSGHLELERMDSLKMNILNKEMKPLK